MALGKPQEPHKGQSRALRDTPHRQPAAAHGATGQALAAPIWPRARAQSSPVSKGRALQGGLRLSSGTMAQRSLGEGPGHTKGYKCPRPGGRAAPWNSQWAGLLKGHRVWPFVTLGDAGHEVSRGLCDITEPHPGSGVYKGCRALGAPTQRRKKKSSRKMKK